MVVSHIPPQQEQMQPELEVHKIDRESPPWPSLSRLPGVVAGEVPQGEVRVRGGVDQRSLDVRQRLLCVRHLHPSLLICC